MKQLKKTNNVKSITNDDLRLTRVSAFAVSVSEKFVIKTLKEQLIGHLQRELVPVLLCFPVLIIIDFKSLQE